MKLQVFLEEKEIASEERLREELKHRKDDGFGAFWLIEDNPILALFINRENACLYYMPETEDDSWSKNKEPQKIEMDTVDFMIENYQVDEISKDVVISTSDAIEAFIYYYQNKKLSDAIEWC